jgi:hypothetical protein
MKLAIPLSVVALFVSVGVAYSWPWSSAKPEAVTSSGITITNDAEDQLSFERIYVKHLTPEIELSIRAQTDKYIGRMLTAHLCQPNGTCIHFDPKAVAEHILDPPLVLTAQQTCDEIIKLDKAYMDSHPQEFRDNEGRLWRVVPSS